MKSYQVIVKKGFVALIFLCFLNNCFAYRDHDRYVVNNSKQPWTLVFSFTEGADDGAWSNPKIIGLVMPGSDCTQDENCVVNAGETKKLIYRSPAGDLLARNYNGTVKIIDSNKKSFIYVIQGQYFHFGPWIYENSDAPVDVVKINDPKGGDIKIIRDFWDSK